MKEPRPAVPADVPALRHLIDRSVRGLSPGYYTPAQIESSLRFVFGPDTRLIADGTYYVVDGPAGELVAAGGWGRRRTLYGGDQTKGEDDPPLDPVTEPARVRAFYVDPIWARRGLARWLFERCAADAARAGFRTLELMATLPGEPLYRALGFVAVERVAARLPDGESLPLVRMTRPVERPSGPMRLIPVLDVLHGVVVRGVGGRRSEYRPIVSRLTSSTNPVEVARALVDTFHPAELYLADLDALGGAPPAVAVYRAIRTLGVRLWVDAGVRDSAGAKVVADAGCDVVAGLETVPGPVELRAIVEVVGAERVVFSLDLRDGVPLREWPGQDRSPVPTVIACGITRLIVLDLARVGGGAGTGTDDLCRELASTYPHVEVIAGGGVAGPADLRRLAACGIRGVLVASALHDGRIQETRNAEVGMRSG